MALTGKKPSELDTATINSLKTVLGINPNSDFKGLATTSTNPGTPEAPCYYLAAGSGTYTNFGGLAISGNLAFLSWNGSAWAKYDTSIAIDNFYNVTTEIPLTVGNYYNDTTARSAVPAGSRKLGLCVAYLSGIKEVWSLTCTAPPSIAGNVTLKLNDKSITVAIDPAVESTIQLVIAKILAAGFTGWTIYNGTTYLNYTRNEVGVSYSGYYSVDAGDTGAVFTLSKTTIGEDLQWKVQQFIGLSTTTWTTNEADWVVNSLSTAASKNQVDFSKSIDYFGVTNTGVLGTAGRSWVFKVKERSYLYCEYPLLHPGRTNFVFYYAYPYDFTTKEHFIANATLVGTEGLFTGRANIPAGADYALINYLDNNAFRSKYSDRFTILIDEDNSAKTPIGYGNIKDVGLRDYIDARLTLKKDNKSDDYGLVYWNRVNDQYSTFMSSNGAFVDAAHINLLDSLVSEASDNLKAYGVINSLKLATDTYITHGGINHRRFQQVTYLPKQDLYPVTMVAGYKDLWYYAAFLVKYDGDIGDLYTIAVGLSTQSWIYNVNTSNIRSITSLGNSVYKIIFKTTYTRIAEATFNAQVNQLITTQFEVPMGMEIEIGGFMLWYNTAENDLRFLKTATASSVYESTYCLMIPDLLAERESTTSQMVKSKEIQALRSRIRELEYGGFDQANVVWLGTSVPNEPPFGEVGTLQYPQFVRDILHFNLTNKSIVGTKLTTDIASGIYGLAMTQSEYDANSGAAGVERSYETQLSGLWDSDLFVFDHFHNDLSYLTALVNNVDYWDSNLGTYKITEANKYDRTWAVGAANYIIAEIYKRNPRAKILMINDWRAEKLYNKLACQVVADFWALPICNPRMGNANVSLTTTQDTYLKPYNGGVNIKLLAGSIINPLAFQTKQAPDESATVPTEEEEILFTLGSDFIHPGRYGRIMYAKHVAKWMLNNVSLDNDTDDYYFLT